MSERRARWTFAGHPVVFPISAAFILAFVLLGVLATGAVEQAFQSLQNWIVKYCAWLYILAMSGFLVFVLWLGMSRHGRLRLGPDGSRPEFSTPTWLAMLFSAGMGIGLIFFGVAEPVTHFAAPPTGSGGDPEAARRAMGLTLFHWGLHPWALYTLTGVALAYFGFRHNLSLSLRSAFQPLLGERIHGPIGNAIDILAVVATLFGVATSLGLGAMQINAGLAKLLGISQTTVIQIALIAAITALATISVVTGLHRGIRRLSECNMLLAALLLAFVFVFGPTLFLLNALVENLGAYLRQLPVNSFRTAAFQTDAHAAWLGNWTLFYWAWWISWSPFVGLFIARISYGRTVREFVVCTLLVPTVASLIWFTTFGSAAIHQALTDPGLIAAVRHDIAAALFVFLDGFPLPSLSAALAMACVLLFFVTSSDSGSLVIDMLASGGKPNPPLATRLFWAITEGVVAAVLLLAGGLQALQTAALTTALPFCLVLILICFSLYVGLIREKPARGA